jgi:hypothetical protein
MSAVPGDDDRPTRTAWCSTCRATQPCAPVAGWGDKNASPPHRCLVCDQLVPNPIIRLFSRRTPE